MSGESVRRAKAAAAYHSDSLITHQTSAGTRKLMNIIFVTLSLLLIYNTAVISGYIDINNEAQQYAMNQVRSWKEKQKSFINVMNYLKGERAAFINSRAKPLAIDREDALELASPILDKLNINKTMFDSMVAKNTINVVNLMSWELENGYIIDMGTNSIEILGNKSSDMMNLYTVEDYGEEMYFSETTMTETNDDHFAINTKRGSYERYETRKPYRRIRNRISAGLKHLLILMPNGKLYSTGAVENGNLGRIVTNDSRLIYNAPVQGLDGLDILQIEANQYTSLVLTNKGIYAFGLNANSQLATGGTKIKYIPYFVNGFSGGTKIEQIALGYHSGYAIDVTGKLWGWGANDQGQLGDRTWDEKNRPFSVYRYAKLLNQTMVKVCAGYKHALVLSNTSRLFSMGYNGWGQLGTNNYVSQGEPIEVITKHINETIIDIQCGYGHNLLLTESGRIFSWGYNNYGQLGDGTTGVKLIPTQLTQFGSSALCTPVMIHTKSYHNFVYCKDGSLYSWGRSDTGQTGTGTINANVLTPTKVSCSIQPIVDITSNEDNSYLYYADGSVYAVGSCHNVEFFAGSSCYDTNPYHWTGTPIAKTFTLSPNGKFVRMNNHVTTTLPWYMRKMTYYDLGETSYLLKADNTVPSLVNNGFNMYTRNISDNVWSLVEYNSTSNEGFPDSIHNSHFLKHNEEMFLFGGIVNNNVSNAIYKCPLYDLKQWEKTPFTLPLPVASGMIMPIGDYIYIFGGISRIYSYAPSVDIEHPSNKPSFAPIILDTIMRAPLSNVTDFTIVNGSVIPTPLYSAFIEIVGNYVYLFGGTNTFDSSSFNIFRATLDNPLKWEMTFGLLPYYMTSTGIMSSKGDNIYVYSGSNSTYGTSGPFFAMANKEDPVGSWMAVVENEGNRTADWCKKHPYFCIHCNDIQASSQSVCSSKGVCIGYDVCQCDTGRFGSNCELVGIVSIGGLRRYADGSYPKSCSEYKNPTNSTRVYQGMIGRGLYLTQASPTTPPIILFCEQETSDFQRHDVYTIQSTTYWNANFSSSLPKRMYPNMYWSKDYTSPTSNISIWSTDSVENYCRSSDTAVPSGKYYCFGSPLLGVVCTYGGLCVDGQCFCGPSRYGASCSIVGIVGCDGKRTYADFTFARTCYEYYTPTNSSRRYTGGTGDGVYILNPNLNALAPFDAYCDMATGGYTLISKTSEGQPHNPVATWNAKTAISGTLDKFTRDTVLTSTLLDYWSLFSQARLEITKGSSVRQYITFSTTGYSYNLPVSGSWFTIGRVQATSFHLDSVVDFTPGSGARQFIVERGYNGCGNDHGWIMVNFGEEGCEGIGWQHYYGPGVSIRYATGSTATYWSSTTTGAFADTLIIMAR